MFNLKIKDTNYIVYKECEFNSITPVDTIHFFSIPNYYDLSFITTGNRLSARLTNNKPMIIESNDVITYDEKHKPILNCGMAISHEDYKILYEQYLDDMKDNPDELYLLNEKRKNDVEYVKTLRKHK